MMGEPSPLSAMCARGSWFPDKRGMATGMAIMGFGGGAMIAAPVKQALLKLVNQKYVRGWDDPRMPTISRFGRRCRRPHLSR